MTLILRFQVLTAASMKMAVFSVVAPCSLLEVCRLYGAATQKTAIFDDYFVLKHLSQKKKGSYMLYDLRFSGRCEYQRCVDELRVISPPPPLEDSDVTFDVFTAM
jgi:hypothetical protein